MKTIQQAFFKRNVFPFLSLSPFCDSNLLILLVEYNNDFASLWKTTEFRHLLTSFTVPQYFFGGNPTKIKQNAESS